VSLPELSISKEMPLPEGDAVAQDEDHEDKRGALKQDTLKAWDDYQTDGLHIATNEVDKWLESWGSENELLTPECCK
jgi:predicted transcriptional regulator